MIWDRAPNGALDLVFCPTVRTVEQIRTERIDWETKTLASLLGIRSIPHVHKTRVSIRVVPPEGVRSYTVLGYTEDRTEALIAIPHVKTQTEQIEVECPFCSAPAERRDGYEHEYRCLNGHVFGSTGPEKVSYIETTHPEGCNCAVCYKNRR